MDLHNGYRTLGHKAVLAQLHPCTASIAADEDGLLPEWIVYNDLVATPRVFLSKVSLQHAGGPYWFDCRTECGMQLA